MILISKVDGLTVHDRILKKGDFFKADEAMEKKFKENPEEFVGRARRPEREELIYGFVYSGQISWQDLDEEEKRLIDSEIEARERRVKAFWEQFKTKKREKRR